MLWNEGYNQAHERKSCTSLRQMPKQPRLNRPNGMDPSWDEIRLILSGWRWWR